MPQKLGSKEYQERVHEAWKHFIHHEDYDYSFLRPEILSSWMRAREMNVDPYNIDYNNLTQNDLTTVINKHINLINVVRPYIENLYEIVKGSGAYILLCDKNGYIIDLKGDPDIIAQGATTNLGMGAIRLEKNVGTNGIGTALYTKSPIQIWGEEHYACKHKQYTCSGAPLFDADGNLYGCLNVTVSFENAHLHTLGMVVCAADGISKELKLRQAMENIEMINAQRNSIIENMTSGVILLNARGQVSQINDLALKMLNISYRSIIGQDLFDYITIDSSDRYVAHTILQTEKYNEEVSVKNNFSTAQPKRFNLSINHICDAHGGMIGYILLFNKPELINRLVNNIGGFHANYTFDSIIGGSPAVQKLIADSTKAAQSDSNILILGESGTGKELVAQSIHNASPVKAGPFVAINCAAIPNTLMESELFGYEKGSFTGAEKGGRPGKFEMADGGTIFLDEVGDMPLNLQAALLRVLQTHEVIRIGGQYSKHVNIRIVAATNQDLQTMVQEKTFREDLYYRLNVISIFVPTLVARGPEDIRLLATHFIDQYNARTESQLFLTEEACQVLQHYAWPGNVRQLENVIERAISLRSGDAITLDDLPETILSNPHMERGRIDGDRNGSAAIAMPSGDRREAFAFRNPPTDLPIEKKDEKSLIVSALAKCNGKATAAAEMLGMNRRTFYRKVDKYQINMNDYRI